MFFLIWRGWGILAFLIPLLFFVIGTGIDFNLQSVTQVANYIPLVFLFLSAPVVWFLGVRLNSKPPRKLIDPQTNQQVLLKKTHSLFWVPMQYWAIVVVILGLITIATQL